MSPILLILALVLHVNSGERINDALDSARAVYASRAEQTTIYIEPGTYEEELTIDIPGLRLINASRHPSIALLHNGVDCNPQAVRITWYYGHGYQYASMGNTVNYGGSRTRLWNASVLVTAPDFYAENIIFQNSFNLYVSPREAQDTLVDISQSPLDWTEKERPKRVMPDRPKEVYSTEVQKKHYRERAAAISFASTATNARLVNCRAVGRQDVLYGDQGASVYWKGGILQGAVDFIFGALKLAVDRATIVANINGEKGDRCYIAAGRSENTRGMLFYRCHIRLATDDELLLMSDSPKDGLTTNDQLPTTQMVWLARPWRYWGETVWAYTTWDEGILVPEAWSTGLTKGQPCPNSYEYRSQDLLPITNQQSQITNNSSPRPSWVTILTKPRLPNGTRLNPKRW